MSLHRAWMLSVGLLLVVGLIGCGEKPQRIAREPEPVVNDPKPIPEKPAPVVDDPKLQQLVREKAQEYSTALVEGDYGRFVDLTYPKVVERGGGRDKMIAQIKSGVTSIDISSVKVDVPTEFAMAGPDLIAIIPAVTEMGVPVVGEVTLKSFLIGVSNDKGKTWTFIDGTSFAGGDNIERFKKLLPGFPDTLKLPKVEKPDVMQMHEQIAYARDTEVQLAFFQSSLVRYCFDLRDYPTTAQGLESLRAQPIDLPDQVRWKGPYLNDPVPLDPWGNPYQYEYSQGDEHPRIYSFGPDGLKGTEDEIILDWGTEDEIILDSD